jgi:hypothetical protein
MFVQVLSGVARCWGEAVASVSDKCSVGVWDEDINGFRFFFFLSGATAAEGKNNYYITVRMK